MADEPPAPSPPGHRAYRAACPNCGAPVEFASSASASAVCGSCRSTLLRDGASLRRIGVSAELFDDHSPLQLGASGKLQGLAFTLVGRLQVGYEGGSWNEWHALFDNGRSAWLSEDNGAYVVAFDAPTPADAPPLEELTAGEQRRFGGQAWSVASVVRAHLIAAEGELPSPPRLDGEFLVVDLRNVQDEVGTLDGSGPARPHWSLGRPVALSQLQLQGLREIGEKTLKAEGVACPNCGTAIALRLEAAQSVVCGQCSAVVDLSAGPGAELTHFVQRGAHREPLIPLGRSGTLACGAPPQTWQVVGYLERKDLPEPGSDDETSHWREYLLHHPTEGFVFLVDTDEGWSWVRPITGVPMLRGDQAEWNGVGYSKRWDYDAEVTWVQGEFYWRIKRGERARVTDYEGTGQAADKRLSRERTRGDAGEEVTWSAGATIDAAKVAAAFGIQAPAGKLRDASPASGQGALRKVLIAVAVMIVLSSMLSECDGDGCDEVRTTFGASSNEYQQCLARSRSGGFRVGGGSFGGWSSGGGHK